MRPAVRGLSGLLVWGLVGVLAFPPSAWALGPLEKDHPQVEKGREAYAAGRFEEALQAFEAARKEKPDDVAVEFNRADALAKLGRIDEAKAAFQRVADAKNRPELQQKAQYNLGNLFATTGDRQEALKAYRRALKMNPSDAQARHNYEVVLRNLPPPDPSAADGGTDGGSDGGQGDGGNPDAGADGGQKGDGGAPVDGGSDGGMDGGSDGGADGGADGGGGDGGQGDGGQGDGGQGDGGSDAGSDGGQQGDQRGDAGADAGQGDGGEQGEGEPEEGDGGTDAGSEGEQRDEPDAGMSPEEIDRQEAERQLDRIKQNEKNLQLWRFQQKKKPRKPNEKDW